MLFDIGDFVHRDRADAGAASWRSCGIQAAPKDDGYTAVELFVARNQAVAEQP